MAEQQNRPSVLGRQWSINGDLTINDDAIIEGQVEGTVRVSGQLHLADGARVQGTIIGESVRIAGAAEGDIVSPQDVELLPGAKFRGRVYSTRFCVNEGAGFRGEIWCDDQAMQAAQEQVLSKLEGQPAAPQATPPRAAPAPVLPNGNGNGKNGNGEHAELSANELAMLTHQDGRGPLRMRPNPGAGR
jgi:cytoskeletal protein CcmA (bactofilin family)